MGKTFEPINDQSNSGQTDNKAVDSLTHEEQQTRDRITTFTASNSISRDELHDRQAPDAQRPKRLGFLKGRVQVPDDFNSVGSEKIDQLFGKEP